MSREDTKKRNFLEAFRYTFDAEKAMSIVGINENTLLKWLEDDDEFYDGIASARKASLLKLENLAFQQALEGDKSQIQFMLKSHMPDTYNKSVSETNITSVNLTKIEDNRVAGMSPEEAQRKITENTIKMIEQAPGGTELLRDLRMIDGEVKDGPS